MQAAGTLKVWTKEISLPLTSSSGRNVISCFRWSITFLSVGQWKAN